MAFRVLPDANLAQVVTDGDMGGNIVSEPFNLHNCANASIEMVWDGDPTGPFSVQVSNDYQEDLDHNVQNAGSWLELPLTVNISANGTPDTAYIEINDMSAPYLRIIYATVGGAGTLNAYIAAKGN